MNIAARFYFKVHDLILTENCQTPEANMVDFQKNGSSGEKKLHSVAARMQSQNNMHGSINNCCNLF